MSKSDMVNRTRVGLSYKVEECAPPKSKNKVDMIFSQELGGDVEKISIRIVEAKPGGRTYVTEAYIDRDSFNEIAKAFDY